MQLNNFFILQSGMIEFILKSYNSITFDLLFGLVDCLSKLLIMPCCYDLAHWLDVAR